MPQADNKRGGDRRVGVLLPLVFRRPFDYRLPEGMDALPGDYVRVPFGKKSLWGVIWGDGEGEIAESKVRMVEKRCAHLPPMRGAMRKFIDWAAWYTLSISGQMLKMALASHGAFDAEGKPRYLPATGEIKAALTPARVRILSYLADGVARTAAQIRQHAKVSPAVLQAFIRQGGLQEVTEETSVREAEAYPSLPEAGTLSPAQAAAAATLCAAVGRGFSVTVLDGVTGSGKTEVYFSALAECLGQGRQALVMLPEIALSLQWLERFERRFGFAPALWHSSVTPAKKRKTWQAVAQGEASVVVGARSSLFLPFGRLGLIIVDEEHDPSYKQEEGVIYQARDMAVARARFEAAPVVLASATPSLETLHNVETGRYAHVHLPDRHNEAELPAVRLIDMRRESLPKGCWISPTLASALGRTMAAGHQAMVFMNRRGYAPLLLCKACGHRLECPHCSACMVVHKKRGTLQCHHCSYVIPVPEQCPSCKEKGGMIPYGPGAERIGEELRELFPDARIALLTSDEKENEAGQDVLSAMGKGEIDILVGTQMMAKGHHFAKLALVGVADADMGLGGGDLRAGERTYQLLHQLAGRAGREHIRGEVYIQTYMPEHPVMRALALDGTGDERESGRDAFMRLEASMRRDAGLPPYGRLANIIVEGKNDAQTLQFARSLAQQAHVPEAAVLLGPAPAPLLKLHNRYRYRLLVKAGRDFPMQRFLADWLLERSVPSAFSVKIDVDPYSFA